MSYGFALRDNRFDEYPLKLVVCGDPKGETKQTLGPFAIRRATYSASDEWEQFPGELWAALAGAGDEADR